ncbi:MAG: DUF47 domain-containing protein [Acidimicrobiales bacterium]
MSGERHLRRWFLPKTPDVLALLAEQARATIEGIDCFVAWSGGDAGAAQAVDDAEHKADRIRRQLDAELRAAFSTPLEPEDIYELSERLDDIINGAKNAVREAEVMDLRPDAALAEMAAELADGVRHLLASFEALVKEPDRATAEADAAIKCSRRLERSYRVAMSRLLGVEDLRAVIAWREMYRRYSRLGDSLVQVAERVWYSVVKSE